MANDLSAFNSAKFSEILVQKLDRVNVMRPLVNTDWEGDLSNNQTVYVRTLGSVSMGSWTKNGTISYQDLAPAKEAFTVSDAEYFAFKVDDMDIAQSDINALDAYAERAAVALGVTVDRKILSAYSQAGTTITGASNAAIELTSDNIYSYFVQAAASLNKNNVPQAGRFAIIDPDTLALVQQSPSLIRSTAFGDGIVQSGNLSADAATRANYAGKLAGFDVYYSVGAPAENSSGTQVDLYGGSADHKYLLFGDRYAIAYAAQITRVEPVRLETTFGTAIRGLLLHDTKVFNESAKRLVTVKAALS